MKSICRLLTFLVLLSVAVSCDLASGKKSDSELSLILKSETAGRSAGEVGITVRAYGAWDLDLDFLGGESWAKLTHVTGTGYKGNVKLVYEENTTGASRSLYVVLTSESGDIVETKFTQNSDGTGADGGISDVAVSRWMELPETKSGDGLKWGWHDMTLNGVKQRNYSFYFSSEHSLSYWVAYPLNASLMGGTSMRSEDFRFDPLLSDAVQADLTWFYKGPYDRGHQLPARDRSASSESNSQTYYATNMTPQRSRFNGGIWGKLEGTVRGWTAKMNSSTDTLYVVTGCVAEGSTESTYDSASKRVTIPVAYYKALLRYTRSSGTYEGCAVWLDHNTSASSVSRSDLMSIDALEEKLGIDLFVNLPSAVGAEKAAQIEAKAPTENAWPL